MISCSRGRLNSLPHTAQQQQALFLLGSLRHASLQIWGMDGPVPRRLCVSCHDAMKTKTQLIIMTTRLGTATLAFNGHEHAPASSIESTARPANMGHGPSRDNSLWTTHRLALSRESDEMCSFPGF